MPGEPGAMKVKIAAVLDDMSEGWSATLDVIPEMKVRELKDLLTMEPHFLMFSKATKILARQASGMMYTLDDKAKVKKDMVLRGAGLPEKRATSPAKDAKARAAAKPVSEKIAAPPPSQSAEVPLNAVRPSSMEPTAIPKPAVPPAPERTPPAKKLQWQEQQQKAPPPKPLASAAGAPSAQSKAKAANVQTSSSARLSGVTQDPLQTWWTAFQPVWPNYFRAPHTALKKVATNSARQLAQDVIKELSNDAQVFDRCRWHQVGHSCLPYHRVCLAGLAQQYNNGAGALEVLVFHAPLQSSLVEQVGEMSLLGSSSGITPLAT